MNSSTISHEAAIVILNDFKWHHRREFIPLTRLITPEKACRAYVRAVPQRNKSTRVEQDLATKIRQGRARIVDEYIRHLKKRELVEVDGKGVEKQLRLVRRVYIDRFGKLVGDLKRCPCCDGKPLLIDVFNFEAREFRAECENCHIHLSGEDRQTVVTAWNLRPSTIITESAPALDDELRKTNENLAIQCASLDAALTEAENACANRTRERDKALATIQQLAQQNFSIVVQ